MEKDITVIIEKLSSIAELDESFIQKMNEKQLQSYVSSLNVTAHTFPVQKEELEYAFQNADYQTVLNWLEIIKSGLMQIHAERLVKDCEKQLSLYPDTDSIRPERLKIFINYIMSSLSILFSDIHDALEFLDLEESETPPDEISPISIKEKLYTIAELNHTMIKGMTDEELYDYIDALHSFCNNFPAQDNGLSGSIKIKHYVFVLQWLAAIEDSLTKINADELAEECREQISINKDFNNIRHEKLEAFINYILSTLSMLSADIKMLHLPKEFPKEEQPEDVEHVAVEFELLSPGASPDSKTVLVVNKMTIFMNSLKNALGETEHRLIGVTSAEAAASYLKTAKPDLFIIDEDLPGADGHVLIKKIRAVGQMAPIVFTTSNITKEKMVKFMEAGVADFILKPITAGDVQKKVAKHLP